MFDSPSDSSPTSASKPSLSPEMQRLLLQAIVREWDSVNSDYFQNRLSRPVFTLSGNHSTLGRWCPQTRTIELNLEMVTSEPWIRTVHTLKHEMAHQYVSEIAKVDEAPHGPTFRACCANMGISARARGHDSDYNHGHKDDEQNPQVKRLIERVQRLLALAQSPNQNEAETAATMAQSLMLRHNLSQEATSPQDSLHERYQSKTLGQPAGRYHEHARRIASVLGQHYFVQPLWIRVYCPELGKYRSLLEISGTPANLEMASFVYDFLHETSERLWYQHKKQRGIRSNRDRLTFMAGVVAGFDRRLEAQSQKFEQEEGLVWLEDEDLRKYQRRLHPRIRTVSYGGRPQNPAYQAGQDQGQRLILHRPVQDTNHRPQGPRALKS